MSRFGEFVLRKLSRPPEQGDYLNDAYEAKHRDVAACVRAVRETAPGLAERVAGRRVLDIGCAEGLEAVALALLGAREVVGIDTRMDARKAEALRDRHAPGRDVRFHATDAARLPYPDGHFDAVVTLGSLEHFRDPFAVLAEARRLLADDGRIILTSGVWGSPWGAHVYFFTKLPWVQFLFSERTIMNVRRLYRSDGARAFHEVEGGLNRIGVRSFLRGAKDLGFEVEYFALSPVKGIAFLTRVPLLNELFSHLMTAVLVPRKARALPRALLADEPKAAQGF